MKISNETDIDIINAAFERSDLERISIEELREKRPNVFYRVYLIGWRTCEEHQRQRKKELKSTKPTAQPKEAA